MIIDQISITIGIIVVPLSIIVTDTTNIRIGFFDTQHCYS